MYKIMVHINNGDEFLHSAVCVEIQLPAVPRKGEILYLSDEQIDILQNKAKSDLKIAKSYRGKWFNGDSAGCKVLKQKHLQDLDFGDAIYVRDVVFSGDSEFIQIELDDNMRDINVNDNIDY